MTTDQRTTTVAHRCGDHVEIRDTDTDTGTAFWFLRCVLCGHRWTQVVTAFCQEPPSDAVFHIDPGGENPS
jgi:hypothetical protein